MGLLPGADYETGRVDFHIGDVLVLYTDGVVEAENPEGEEYSAQRLARMVGSHLQQRPSELIETIYASIGDFRETTLLADDFTLVVLKRVASETR
jgi:sigma-B regulation protein RsbU (phosphoserine phosphatase)